MTAKARIIHNQRVLMNDQEWADYQEIARSYDRQNFKGEDLFRGLFNTDEAGMITYIGIPKGTQTSMEVFFFVCALYEHQKMRALEARVDEMCQQLEKAKK